MGRLRRGSCLGVMLLLAGCGEQQFRAEMTWHADGRVERAVYQPAEFVPMEARQGWQTFRTTAEIPSASFSGSIRELDAAPGSEPPYIAAWGSFLSPERLPDHVRVVSSDPARAARLERTVAVNRLGFVTEYVWRETLTDVVSLGDMQLARREASALVVDLVEASLRDGTLKLDVSGLLAWLRTDGAALFDELHSTFVEAAIRREQNADSGTHLAGRLADVCAKYGLVLRDSDGTLVEGNAFEEAFDRFVLAKVRETVRTPEGARIDEAAARDVLRRLGFSSEGNSLSWQPTASMERALESRFGSLEAAEAKGGELQARLLGAWEAGVLTPKRPFRYEMSMPGTVIATTGERIGENRVVWRFDAAEAFPLGYEMRARSLAANEAAQKAVLGEVRLSKLEEMAEYASLLASDPGLAAAMTDVTAKGSLQPLDAYEAGLRATSGVEPVLLRRVESIRKLVAP